MSTIHSARVGSAWPEDSERVVKPAPSAGSPEVTVTAMFGIVRVSALRTTTLIVAVLEMRWSWGNDALTTSTLKVSEGSFLSCRSPPPQPAKRPADAMATALVAHHALQDRSTARGPYQRQVSCGAGGRRGGSPARRFPFGTRQRGP